MAKGLVALTRHDIGALTEVIRTLQGSAVPASIIERDVLPARMEYRPELLDQLMVAGEVVWVGRGSDRATRRQDSPSISAISSPCSTGTTARIVLRESCRTTIRAHLSDRGRIILPGYLLSCRRRTRR